jgi:hypothetical protein
LVGPNGDVNVLQMKSVCDRPYFKNHGNGIQYFERNDDGIWELRHPRLPDIEPQDFVFVAEYLESNDFGHRHPSNGKELDEAFAQCVSAWFAAVLLGMFDLMDHVVEKLKRFDEPGLYETICFAIKVYRSPDTGLLSYEELKDYLATLIAQNWWIYLEDDHLRAAFVGILSKLPKLERDIYARRLEALNERISQADIDTEMD